MASNEDVLAPSNGIRLTLGEWAFVIVVTVVGGWVAMASWDVDPSAGVAPDYRVPHELNEDYWFFRQAAARAAAHAEVVVLGDSVIWGAYVKRGDTLPALLTRSDRKVANLGVQGAHPAALAGLIEHHGGAIRDRIVVVHLNPLWMSSLRQDLREDKEVRFNHPDLVPQFNPWLPSYKATVDARLGAVVRRNNAFLLWTRHLQLACYEGLDIPTWTVAHPHDDPFARLALPTPPATAEPRFDARPWTDRRMRAQRYSWVDPEESVQWASMRRAVEVLRERRNRVLALVGPLNEHAMEDVTRDGLRELRRVMTEWLTHEGVAFVAPDALASEMYADVSHPLADGYRRLAHLIEPELSRIR